MREHNEPKYLICELAQRELIRSVILSNRPGPGEIIRSLPEAQRVILEMLTSADVEEIRWPPY